MNNWHEETFFGIHYDLHAGKGDTELGKRVTHEHLRERWLQVKPEWVQCDCKGHPGWTSWPTEIGCTSPGVVKDALSIHREVTRELGIKLVMHYSGVIDERQVELHPEWACINAAGNPVPRTTCLLSDYLRSFMIPHLIEIIHKYDVDGFWIDGDNWAARPCWCERCKTTFTEKTGVSEIPRSPADQHWHEWLKFHRDNFVAYVTAYTNAIHKRKPECVVCSNWMYTLRQPERVEAPVDFLSGDYTQDWGANRAATEGRMLDSRRRTWDLIVWGFTRPNRGQDGAGLWSMKNATHLCHEVSEVLALGGAVIVYNSPERTGWLTGWHHDILQEVGDFCRARKEVCFKSRTVPQAAVLHLASSFYMHNDPLFNYGKAIQPVEGALNAMMETHRSVDILLEENVASRIDAYKLVIVPEQDVLTPEIVQTINNYVSSGGHVLMSGERLSVDYPDLVGAVPKDPEAALPGGASFAAGDAAIRLAGPWRPVTPTGDTEIVACRLKHQEPSEIDESAPLISRRRIGEGSLIAVHGPLFRNYFLRHFPYQRAMIGELVDSLPIEWDLEVEKGDARLEVVVRRKGGKLMVNLINRGAGETLGPNRVMNETIPPLRDIRFRVPHTKPPADVILLPGEGKLRWNYEDGWLIVEVAEVPIHEVVVIQ